MSAFDAAPRLARPPARPRESYRRPVTIAVPLPGGGDLASPFFTHRQSWTECATKAAGSLASGLADKGIAVFGLACDFENNESGETPDAFQPNGCVYSAERLGLRREDLQSKQLIELRLGIQLGLDQFGRHPANSVLQYLPPEHGLQQVTAVTARTWPPDVGTRKGMRSKVNQLRHLAGEAVSILTSQPAYDWTAALNLMADIDADGLLLEFDVPTGTAFPTAADIRLILQIRKRIAELANVRSRSFLFGAIAPVPNAHAAALLLAAGIDLLSIDHVVTSQLSLPTATSTPQWGGAYASAGERTSIEKAIEEVAYFLDDFTTLLAAMDIDSVNQLQPREILLEGQRLGGFDG